MSASTARPKLTREQRLARQIEATANARRLERIHKLPTTDHCLRDPAFLKHYLRTLKAECKLSEERIPRLTPEVWKRRV